jgi:magnesium transporter
MESHERVREAAENIVKGIDDARDRAVIEDAHPEDLAQALGHLPVPNLVGIFRLLRPEQASNLLSALDDETLIQLVQGLEDVEVADSRNRLPAEEAADIVEELPEEQAEKILDLMEDDKSEDVQELLEYPEQSAGRLMSPEVVAVHESSTVEDAIQHIRKSVHDEKAFELYVVDDHRHLVGVVPLRRLLVAAPRTRILAVRNEDVVSVTPETDREEVARVVAKYDLVSVPVVDGQHRLVGTISVDDVIDIVGEEASEDIFRIAGSDASTRRWRR